MAGGRERDDGRNGGMSLEGTLGFLGFGNMGSAIARGLLATGTATAGQLAAYDPDPARQAEAVALGCATCADATELARHARTLLVAVKPQQWREACVGPAAALDPESRVISIMAGVSLRALESVFGHDRAIIRVMPNTPAQRLAGAAALALNAACGDADREVALGIFQAVGIAVLVEETQLDAVTALSGSGPAYFFYLAELLIRAGIAEGLDPETARLLAIHTALGAGKMLVETGEPPATLREKVTSKGGTTFAALETFRAGGLEDLVLRAVRAAADRSRELGGQVK